MGNEQNVRKQGKVIHARWNMIVNELFNNARTRYFLMAIGSGLIQKSVGFFTVIMQYPLLIRILGIEQFGIYVLVESGLSWATIVTNSLTPNIAREVSLAAARDDHEREADLLRAAIRISVLIGVGLIIFGTAIIKLGMFFGYFAGNMISPMTTALMLFGLFFPLSIFDSFLTGYQRQHFLNISTTFASMTGTLLLIIKIGGASSINTCLFSVYSPLILSKIMNIFYVLRIKAYLLHYISRKTSTSPWELIKTTLPFLMLFMSLFCVQSFTTVIVGFYLGSRFSAEYSVVFRCAQLVCSVTVMVNQGFLPALVDAQAKGDLFWIVQVRRWVFTFCLLSAGGCSVLGMIWIDSIIYLWSGFTLNDLLFGRMVSGYLVVWVWRELNMIQLVSAGLIWWAAGIMLLEASVLVALLAALLPLFGISGAGASLLLSGALVSMWAMPLLSRPSTKLGRADSLRP